MIFRFRFLIPMGLTIVVTLAISYVAITQSLNQKEGRHVENLALSEVSAFSQALSFYTEEVKKALINAHLHKDPMNYGPFLALVELSQVGSEQEIKDFRSRSKAVTRNKFKVQKNSIAWTKAEIANQLNFQFIDFDTQQKFIFVFYKANGTIYGGFLNHSDVASLFDAKQTSDHNLFVLANKTWAIVHPEKKYLGAKMDNHPLSQWAVHSKHFTGVKSVLESDKKMILSYEIVSGTNLTMGVVHTISSGDYYLYIQWPELALAMLVVLVGMFLVFSFFLLPQEKTWLYIRSSLQQLMKGEPLTPPQAHMKEAMSLFPSLEALQNQLNEIENSHHQLSSIEKNGNNESLAPVSDTERYSIFKNISLNIVQVTSRPLNALLGYLQIAKVGPDAYTIQKNIDLAQTEIRRVRSLLEDLTTAVKDGDMTLKPVIFDDVLNDILREKLKVFNEKGIKIHKNLQSKMFIKSHPINLEKALSLIVNFFIVNFADQVMRDLYFLTEDASNEVLFKIHTNSDSLTVAQVQALLNPYSEEIQGVEDLLSLAIANTLLQHMGAVISVKPADKEGLNLEVYMPTASEHEVQAFIDGQKSTEDYMEDPSKEEVDQVFDTSQETGDYKILIKHDEENSILSDESFVGFGQDKEEGDEVFFVKSPMNSLKGTKKEDVQTDFHHTTEHSLRLEGDKDLEKKSAIEFVTVNPVPRNSLSDTELPEDDFVMVKPPKASDIPPPLREITDPYLTPTIKTLADKKPLVNKDLELPEVPRIVSLRENFEKDKEGEIGEDLIVEIRRPKLRGDN